MADPSRDDHATQAELARLRAELDEARQIIAQQREQLNAALDGTGLCIWQGLLQTGELQVFNLQGFRREDMASHYDVWYAKVHPDDRDEVVARYQAHLAGEVDSYEAEYRTLGPDQQITWLWDRGRVVERDAEGRALRIMGAHADITERKLAEAELLRLAHSDALTGLPNRKYFFDQLQAAMHESDLSGRPLAVMFIDLDNFKQVNDRFGHVFGDQVLSAVARQLQAVVRGRDLLARLGGDEFILLLQGGELAALASDVGSRILSVLNKSFHIGKETVDIGASIGVSCYPLNGTTCEELVRHADSAMYRAKAEGRSSLQLFQNELSL
ncbi:sensor domain-containing diguanylate cyclase [uncultured Aquitalea sp.]|uniref:sensor domain-containing diguanylate cyclase n=1 Tax=uncultured Aquitalea sp. TaxID=540272 RepID=UPI0025EDFF47|nr:sensor domain-containing diguanylate cyclase [uncultured Aquitalea sp.]